MPGPADSNVPHLLPTRPVQRLTRRFKAFLHIQSATGIVLGIATLVALAAANSSLAGQWTAFWKTNVTFSVGSFALSYPLYYWVNDGLMTIFFFVIGLEIKRELLVGELSEPGRVLLPVAAAIGGAALPALLFAGLTWGSPGLRGWAVPMATDIAFVVGALALLGSRVPPGLKVLMLSLAIVDDLLAVVVIALFYTSSIHLGWLALAALGFAIVALLNRSGVRPIPIYVIAGAAIWVCMLKSGIHPTIGGVFLGLMTPATPLVQQGSFLDILGMAKKWTPGQKEAPTPRALLEQVSFATREAISPLERLEHAFHPWVGFFIMPVFALANAGIVIEATALTSTVGIAIALGLFVGKPLGILFSSFVAVRLAGAGLPSGVTWRVLFGGGILAGIGFTMSLFIAGLGLEGELLKDAKAGIMAGSALSLLVGLVWLRLLLPREPIGEDDAPLPSGEPGGIHTQA